MTVLSTKVDQVPSSNSAFCEDPRRSASQSKAHDGLAVVRYMHPGISSDDDVLC
jgi:hypothetical protein